MKNIEPIEILRFDEKHITEINNANEGFLIIGKIIPSFQEGEWVYEEELFERTSEMKFPDDHLNWSEYINKEDKVIFLAYQNKKCIGQIRLVKDWNKYAYIENIAVRKEFRKSGIGRMLLIVGEEWAKENSLIGMSLEAQNDNLIACRFYIKEEFVLGGVDTLKQFYNPNIDITLYWYKIFT
ncbi:GNAT family N-acetyltransferase [Paenisporosarcina sp. TG20]|uniref:GNAT family N-acetyltransferase n=1 Tax=Paenisporosarcina sp. TG20 TaxID=1211706 RepID=UPI0006841C97|nr:GNAT family N-acetyltransferase [Paenisporosarcina sp. TG20]